MKKFICIGLIIYCFLILFSCQKTPEKELVIEKNTVYETINADSVTNNKANSDNSDYKMQSILNGLPDIIDEQIDSNGITINIDATVETSDATSYPVVEIIQGTFDETFLYNAMDIHFPYVKEFSIDAYSKSAIESDLIRWKKYLADLKQGNTPDDLEGTIDAEIKSAEQTISKLEQEYINTPEEKTISREMVKYTDTEFGNVCDLVVVDDNELKTLNIMNISEPSLDFTKSGNFWFNRERSSKYNLEKKEYNSQNNILISRDDAEKKIYDYFKVLGRENLVIVESYVINYFGIGNSSPVKQAYSYVLSETYSGTPVTIINGSSTPISSEDSASSEQLMAPVFEPEYIEIDINDDGILYCQWMYPAQIINTKIENANLVPFEDIYKRAIEQLKITNFTAPINVEVEINKVVLGYFRAIRKNGGGTYEAIPVWDFIGRKIYEGREKDDNYISLLTINAIDGSVINRNLGY